MKRTPFQSLINEISHSYEVNQLRHLVCWQASAIGMIYQATEAFVRREFESKLLRFIY
jgi:hypothetical protein